MGKAPIELAGGDGMTCTRVAAHPQQEMVAGGFADGLVVLAEVNSSRILPIAPPGRGGPVSALAWSRMAASLPSARKKASQRSSICRNAYRPVSGKSGRRTGCHAAP